MYFGMDGIHGGVRVLSITMSIIHHWLSVYQFFQPLKL